MSEPVRLLFVCYGNIIRSPLAENLFRHVAAEAGAADRYTVDSAGISGLYDNEPPDLRMQRTAAAHGLELTGTSRAFEPEDFARFDLILAMDADNAHDLNRLTRSTDERAKIHLLREFDAQAQPGASVPDPIGLGPQAFEHTYQIVERAVRGLLQRLERGEI
jgi:protein-tyrosine phosphatase